MKRTVLVVEDDFALRKATCLALKAQYVVHESDCIDRAMSFLEGNACDVVVSDYAMPEGTGVMLATAMRERGMKTPVIIVTAMYDSPEIGEARARGDVVDVLRKPWTISDLMSCVERAGSNNT